MPGQTENEFVVVSTTVDTEARAVELARLLVDGRLAACVQRAPVTSTYRWQGSVDTAQEFLLVAKTRAALAEEVQRAIREAHSYELPEIVVTPISGGSNAYLNWIRTETKSSEDGTHGR